MADADNVAIKGIFLSYRRQDSPGETGRLYDNLRIRQPQWQVFLDIEAIRPGHDFLKEINGFLAQCGLVIVVIGSQWLALNNSRGLRCIDDSMDIVRLELERSLALRIPILPLLVRDARMPSADQLPRDLQWFARLNAVRIRHESFDPDFRSLLATASRLLSADEREIEVELLNSDRRSRTLRVKVRNELYIVQYRKGHNLKYVHGCLTVDGVMVDYELLRSFGTRLTLIKEFGFDLASEFTPVPARLTVRYMSDLHWLTGMKLVINNQTVYTEGKPL